MNHIQEWFERMAGITLEEKNRMATAHTVFARKALDCSELHKPACWRRKTRRCMSSGIRREL